MLRKCFLFCISLVLVFFLPILVSAHPGRTDGDGGHTDHGSGEYHYHHGYPAHDHWDMDGDGDIDCPYRFKDKTEENNGVASNNSVVSDSSNKRDTSVPQEEETKVPAFVYFVIGILIVTIICMYQIIQRKNTEKDEIERRCDRIAKEEEAMVREGIIFLHNALVKKYGEDYLYAISGANEGDFVGKDSYPHSAGSLQCVGIDRYTFYLGGAPSLSVKYHHHSCRYAKSTYPINAVVLNKHRYYSPCMCCPCSLPDTSWVKIYEKHSAFLKRYIDEKELIPSNAPIEDDPGIKINYRGRP